MPTQFGWLSLFSKHQEADKCKLSQKLKLVVNKKWATKSFKWGFLHIVMQFGWCKLSVFVCFSDISICKAKLSEVWEKHIQQLVDLEVGFLMWKMANRFLTCDVNAVSIGLACFVIIRLLCKFLAAYTSLTEHKSSSAILSVCFLFPIYPDRK